MSTKVIISAVFTLLLIISTSAFSCGYSESCSIDDDISSAEYTDSNCTDFPFFSPRNDTRANLFLTFDHRQGISLPSESADKMERQGLELRLYRYLLKMAVITDYLPLQYRYRDEATFIIFIRFLASASWLDELSARDLMQRLRSGYHDENYEAALDFIQGVSKSSLDTNEKKKLIRKRLEMLVMNYSEILHLDFSGMQESSFNNYLQATRDFYLGKYDEALAKYENLAEASQPWVTEASTYMLIRTQVELINEQRSSYNFQGGDDPDQRSGEALSQAIENYLGRYPHGRYASSANALMRRVYWLKGDAKAQAIAYFKLLESAQPQQLESLIEEADRYYLSNISLNDNSTFDQFNLVHYLKQLRTSPYEADSEVSISVVDPTSQSSRIVILAKALFRDKDYDAVINEIPVFKGDPKTNYEFSLMVYRGIALNKLGDWVAAEQHWSEMLGWRLPEGGHRIAQIGLADTWRASNQIAKIVDIPNLITDMQLRGAIIYNATPEEMEHVYRRTQFPRERVFIFNLLQEGYLKNEQYEDYLRLSNDMEDQPRLTEEDGYQLGGFDISSSTYNRESEYQCPPDVELVKTLSSGKKSAHDLNCLGALLGFMADRHYGSLLESIKASHFGLGRMPFAESENYAIDQYIKVINMPDVPDDDRAYALFRAINCYWNGSARCGPRRIDQDERARWFRALKRKYRNSKWAEYQQYYW